MKEKNIGWIGLGDMGTPMAKNLMNAKYNLTVFNRTKEKTKTLAELGAKVADSPRQVITESEVIFLMVADDQAIKDVFNGEKGILHADEKGKIIVNMSTVSPQISREISKQCNEKGHEYLDAPVSGSIKQATDATLVIMVGGSEETSKKVKPALEVLGKKVFYIGDTGQGNQTKLAVNLFLSIVTQGLAESVLFANEMGVEANQILDVINEGGLSSPYVKAKSKSILESEFPSAFALKHMAKDLRLAKDNQFDFALGNAAHESFQQARETLGDLDVMSIIKYLKSTKY